MGLILKYQLYVLIVVMATSFYVGCSKVHFSSQPSKACQEANTGDNSCVEKNGWLYHTIKYDVKGFIDFLIVVDNSGSMSLEQRRMAERFDNFDDLVRNYDYRLAMITTDVSSSPGNDVPKKANGYGAFQDGKLLVFPNGEKFISSDTLNAAEQFKDNIQRSETLVCEQNGFSREHCPSSDERGIFSVNLFLGNSVDRMTFVRPGGESHLSVVFLADEDERSNGGKIPGYPLQEGDRPEKLLEKFQEIYRGEKTLSFHSVIVKPGDTSCLSQQNSQGRGIRAFEGRTYARLSQPERNSQFQQIYPGLLSGQLQSICANNYGSVLANIAETSKNHTKTKILPCRPEKSEHIDVTLLPNPAEDTEYTVDQNGLLSFDPPLPLKTKVQVKITCRK